MTVLVNHCCFRVQSECEANPGPRCFGSLFGAPEGAHTAPPHDLTATDSAAPPDVAATQPASGDVVIVIPAALVEFAWTAAKGVALTLVFVLLAFFAVAVGVAMGGVR